MAAETETEEEVEVSRATKPRESEEGLTVVGIVTETAIAVATATEIVVAIVEAIVAVIETATEVDILAPGRESKRHQRSGPDWPWLREANLRRKKAEIQLPLRVSLVARSLSTQCRKRKIWMRNLPGRRMRRRKRERRQEKLQNPIPLEQPNLSTP